MLKVALVAFQGEIVCFAHVLLNALDLKQRGAEARIIIEGQATQLLQDLNRPENPFHSLYCKTRESGLIEGVCRVCATKTGSLAEAQAQGLPLLDDMSGHPSLGRYLEAGFTLVTF
jgi:hypothetical protein